ncbi:potassium-transporting ATPase subunit KdpB [Pseudolysinimonas kribbensis]|uniref:potassium-transporting ATPase subunit KdpB n=1 Tax=Pseudolysinimonas kribbensis TaxID=433641 RepID=UPI0031DAD94F
MTVVTETSAAASSPSPKGRGSALSWGQFVQALPGAFRKLDPRLMWRNPVMFVVEVGALLSTAYAIAEPFLHAPVSSARPLPPTFSAAIAVWLWITVLFANLAESIAEGRGKAQARSLRATRTSTLAHRVPRYDGADPDAMADETTDVASSDLRLGDVVIVTAGEVIPGDGDIVAGIASVDESAITGESAPVVREHGGDRSAVTGGTRVLSDRIVVRITSKPGETFVDRMIRLVEGAARQKTPNEIALNILLASLTIVFLIVVLVLNPMADYLHGATTIVVLIALLVCLIPTTIGALLSAIGIAGMDRLVQHNVLAMSGRAVEAAGDVTTLLLDKTGTITYGNRRATEFVVLPGISQAVLTEAALMSSLADPTPEGSSIVDLAGGHVPVPEGATIVPFTAQTRMSGLDLADGSEVRKGAGSSIAAWIGGESAPGLQDIVDKIAQSGGTPLVVATKDAAGAGRVLGAVHLKDVVKTGLRERFSELRAMGIRTVMITGDNPLTARAIAAEAGVDDYLAEATPEDKLELIKKEQAGGNLVAMTGDGTNDAPALAQSDVGVAMNTGTSAAKEAGNMVDLDSDPTKLINIVRIGKQLLITRGSLTTFSIANDVAKYFAIIPAMFAVVFPGLAVLNVMHLHSPASAVLSAIVFNALVIVFLIPLALRGVGYRPRPAASILGRNLAIYGLGGLVAPFIGIKLIDLVVTLIPGF